MKATNGDIPVPWTMTKTTYAPSTATSPWARLMILITPNMIERPHASTA